jgi:hypothetical protein
LIAVWRPRRLGECEFVTLLVDLTAGNWQIPASENAVHHVVYEHLLIPAVSLIRTALHEIAFNAPRRNSTGGPA